MAEFQYFPFAEQAVGAMFDYLTSDQSKKDLPDDVREKALEFIRPGGSQTFAMAYFAELVFARAKEIKASEPLMLAASCAATASRLNIDTLAGERGQAISNALQRRAGAKPPQGAHFQKAEDDPEPRPQFLENDTIPSPHPNPPPRNLPTDNLPVEQPLKTE